MASVQRIMLYLTPSFVLDVLCRAFPKTGIGLLCHWVNEKNPNFEERPLAKRFINPVQVAKKISKLSNISLLRLLQQDESLWRMYIPGVGIIPFPNLPYMLLELVFDLGGQEGRKKVRDIAARMRVTVGGRKQGAMFEYFKTDTVLDLFEMLPDVEVRMRLLFNNEHAVAMWLDHWDLRMQRTDQPMKSAYWIGQLPGERAYRIEHLLRDLEFRKKYATIGDIYDKRSE